MASMQGSQSSAIELDLGRYELRRGGRRVKLEKKAMELLILLVRRRDQLVSRADIVARLWSSDALIDTERNLNNVVRKIRTALRDPAAKPRFLETVIGKGYRFIGPVRVISPLFPSSERFESAGGRSPALNFAAWQAERPALAVLPPHLTDDHHVKDNELSLGFADALVSRLANLENVDVLPTSAIMNLPPRAELAETASRLGVRFVVHAALQASTAGSRLSVDLFDSHSQASCVVRELAFDSSRFFDYVEDIATQTARVLKRPLYPQAQPTVRYSRDPLAYAQFIQGYRRSSSGDPKLLEEATQDLMKAVARDPGFALAHAVLSFVCTTHHFEFDPSRSWLERAEFHCQRALDLDPGLPEGHVSKAFLLWGPSRNFQHIDAIAELKRALSLQKNLLHAYNRLGTILAHIGLLDHARTMYERGRPFSPSKALSHSIAQVYLWGGEYELCREELEKWRLENPASKYALYLAPQPAMFAGEWKEAMRLVAQASSLLPDDPMIMCLQGVLYALMGKSGQALRCMNRACANPKSFGHAHHTYYHIASILSLLDRTETAFHWLERSVDTGFACWPFFLKDPCLKNLRSHPEFELLVSSLQARYPDDLGLL
jgi:DNA-binding winged helix-turn-helix (wHTH) protein/tetratricopeptide (TPR) repeat protein